MQRARGARWLVPLVLGLAPAFAHPPRSPLETVQELRPVLEKVSGQKGLSEPLRVEARAVAADADRALRGRPEQPALLKVVSEYKHFVGDLVKRQDSLKEVQNEPPPMSQAQEVESRLKEKVQQTLSHIVKEGTKGMNATEAAAEDTLVAKLNASLAVAPASLVEKMVKAGVADASTAAHALALHDAMSAAHAWFADRSAALTLQEAALGKEITTGTAQILFATLKQRRKLPLKSQLAVLKRKQFRNCSYAEQLLKSHSDKTALYEQLEVMLRRDKLAPQDAAKKSGVGHLEAAGSEGRVLIMSSGVKNKVKDMIRFISGARDKLWRMASAPAPKAETDQDKRERVKAREIVAGLDQTLAKVNRTGDLKAQLEALDEVEVNFVKWTANMTAARAAASH